MTYRIRQGTLCDASGCPVDSGPPIELIGDTVMRAPILRPGAPGWSIYLNYQHAEDAEVVQEALLLAAVRWNGGSYEADLAGICRWFLEVMA